MLMIPLSFLLMPCKWKSRKTLNMKHITHLVNAWPHFTQRRIVSVLSFLLSLPSLLFVFFFSSHLLCTLTPLSCPRSLNEASFEAPSPLKVQPLEFAFVTLQPFPHLSGHLLKAPLLCKKTLMKGKGEKWKKEMLNHSQIIPEVRSLSLT